MTQTVKVYRRSELEAVGDGCLHRYREIWRNGVPDTSDLSLVGIGLHKVKHRYILRLLEKKLTQDMEEAQMAFQEGIAAAMTPNRLIPEMRHLWDWHAERWEFALDQYVTAEERQDSGAVTWAPDLVLARPNELEIVDDKWGWAPPETEDELRGLFQARVYSFYAMTRWPNFQQYRFTLSANRFNKIVSVVFSRQDLDDVQRELDAHIETLDVAELTNHWPAVAGPACRFCELQCPLVDTPMIIPKRFLQQQQAEQVGGWILAAEGILRAAKKTLKGYVAGHGPVSVNGVVWDNRAVESRNYPVVEVMKVLQKHGLQTAADALGDASTVAGLTLSYSSLKKVFKAAPQVEADLASCEIGKTSWRFSAKQPGADEGEADE